MTTVQKLLAWAAVLIVGAGCGLVGAMFGQASGRAEGFKQGHVKAQADQDRQAVVDLTALIGSHKGLIQAASTASAGMRKAVAQRQTADQQFTQDLTHALAQTAGDRAGCLFPADGMRHLTEAHRRAAEAAARGVRGSMPGAEPAPIGPGG